MHSNGIAHRDLKCENMLLDSDYNIRISDFGLAAPLGGKDGPGYLNYLKT